MEILKIFKILICSTNQHQKYDIFHVEHFSQNSKLTLDRSHRDYHALVNKHDRHQERGQKKSRHREKLSKQSL